MVESLENNSSYLGMPVHVVPYKQAEPTFLEWHVTWLRENEELGGAAAVGVKALVVLEAFALVISLVGIIPLIAACRIQQQAEAEKQFHSEINAALANNTLSPPSDDLINMKTQTRSFNHVDDYAIEGGVLWFRKRWGDDREWKPIYLDGWENGVRPIELSVDGANLVVLDQRREVHYKKVAKEYRTHHPKYVNEGDFANNRHLCDEPLSGTREYIAVDKSDLVNWKDRWYSFPILNVLINLFEGKRLQIPSDAKAFAISHRGRFNDALFDKAGNPDYANVGVTTLYVLDKNGRDIIKFDPWSPKHAHIKLFMPETEEKAFVAENLSVSASTLMTVGYEIDRNTGEKSVAVYTNLADIDSMGWNPGLSYTPFINEGNASQGTDAPKIVAPIEPKWKSHPLPAGAEVSTSITILQTGVGNGERQLRVEGWLEGREGIFFKKVDDAEWEFKEVEHTSDEIVRLENRAQVENEDMPETTVYNLTGGALEGAEWKADLLEFGPRSYMSTLRITQGDEVYDLILQKRKGLAAFLGFGGTIEEIIIPEELHENSSLQKLFGGRKIIPISIKEKEGEVVLKTKKSAQTRIFRFA